MPEPGSWQVLFDGFSTEEWRSLNGNPFPLDHWSVENGCLHSLPQRWGKDLITVRQFDNFELELEWKAETEANTGVLYLVREGRQSPYYESALTYASAVLTVWAFLFLAIAWIRFKRRRPEPVKPVARWTRRLLTGLIFAGIVGIGVLGSMAKKRDLQRAVGLELQLVDGEHRLARRDGRHRPGALTGVLPPAAYHPPPPGEFQQARVLLQGSRVEHWMNGVKVLEYDLTSDRLNRAVAASSYSKVPGLVTKAGAHIALQHAQSGVWFRKIRVRELAASPPPR